MCGIAGYLGPVPPSQTAQRECLSRMMHRGPDSEGRREVALGANRAVLLHSRLSIIDLDPRSAQPFEAGGCTMIYNGEIYNYLELRAELEALGCHFRTESDTEVLLQAYLVWGRDVLKRLEGMYSFVIVDPGKGGGVFMARDPFGEKPLHICKADGGIYFASEPKQMAALSGHSFTVNTEKVARFIAHGYRSIFQDKNGFFEKVASFPSAHYAWIGDDLELSPSPYWTPSYCPDFSISRAQALEGAASEIDRAIRIRLRADVPVAISLSGGVDSNVLAGIAVHRHGQQVHTFSMLEADSDYDESAAITTASRFLGTPHHQTRVSHDGFLERLARMCRAYDGPVPSLGMYLDGFLSEAVADAGYKVLVNGNGADEIFSGYYDHYLFWLAGLSAEPDLYDQEVALWRTSLGRHVQNPYLKDPARFVRDPNGRDHLHLNAPDVAGFLKFSPANSFSEQGYCKDLLRCRMLNELHRESVPVLTWAHDSHYMAHSIENRAAYLDRQLVDFMSKVPSLYLIQQGLTKALLRYTGRGIVPEEILGLKKKLGFNAPILSLLDRKDRKVQDRILAESSFWELVDKEKVMPLLQQGADIAGRNNFLFCLIAARLFYEQFVD